MARERDLGARTYLEVDRTVSSARAVALLPIGSTEPHGPHLPLEADVIISVEAARRAAILLAARDLEPIVLPAVPYAVTDFARDFKGGISLSRSTALVLICDICHAALAQGFRMVCLVNSHLEPEHLRVLREAAEKVTAAAGKPVVFPDVTERRWALTLTDEFRSGACHAGQYETSLVIAATPDLVREEIRASLQPVPISLSQAIKQGASSFKEAGGTSAYFGSPSAATRAEGESTYQALAAMVEIAVLEALGALA